MSKIIEDRLTDFFRKAKLSADELEMIRALAQILSPALDGKSITTSGEARACARLCAAWKGIVIPAAQKAGIPISQPTDYDMISAMDSENKNDMAVKAKRFLKDK